MSAILATLNDMAAQQLAKGGMGKNIRVDLPSSSAGSPMRFHDLLTQKSHEKIGDFIAKNMDSNGVQSMQSISAADVQLTVEASGEVAPHAISTDKNTLTNLLTEMNSNMNSLDSMVDMVSSGTQFSSRDLITMQAFMGKAVLATETFTRVGEQGGKAVMTLLNMQV